MRNQGKLWETMRNLETKENHCNIGKLMETIGNPRKPKKIKKGNVRKTKKTMENLRKQWKT